MRERKLGDGLLAPFGYPLEEESQERRHRQARACHPHRPRSGAIVADAGGEIFGGQPLAEPGSDLITVQVQRQVAGLFIVEERGSHALNGVPAPIALFRLVWANGGGRRSGARQLIASEKLHVNLNFASSDTPSKSVRVQNSSL